MAVGGGRRREETSLYVGIPGLGEEVFVQQCCIQNPCNGGVLACEPKEVIRLGN